LKEEIKIKMGLKISKRLSSIFRPTRILMIGLDNAGKTSILYRLKLGEKVQTLPTMYDFY